MMPTERRQAQPPHTYRLRFDNREDEVIVAESSTEAVALREGGTLSRLPYQIVDESAIAAWIAAMQKEGDPMTHVCHLNNAWPTGHPLPPEDPERLTGPEVGEFVVYTPKGYIQDGERKGNEPRIVRVLERSYVWSPGECRHKGGYRNYDWSVVEEGPDKYHSVVVDDTDLSPLPVDWSGRPVKVRLAYVVPS